MADEYRLLLKLSDEDRAILECVCRRLRITRAEAIRMSLRWYALAGPWRQPPSPACLPHGVSGKTLVVSPLEMEHHA